jgi:hypothetical protein
MKINRRSKIRNKILHRIRKTPHRRAYRPQVVYTYWLPKYLKHKTVYRIRRWRIATTMEMKW